MTKVYAIDDDTAILEAIELMLTEDGFEVVTSTDPEILYKNGKDIDLLLLDLLLAGQDGREVIHKLRERKETKNVPIIVLTAHKIDADELYAVGAQGFLAKPFDIYELSELVKRLAK